MNNIHSKLILHATPIRLHSRSLKQNQQLMDNKLRQYNGDSQSKQSLQTKRSVVKDYNLQEVISNLKIKDTKEKEHRQKLQTTNSQNTLFDQFCKVSAGKPRRSHKRDDTKISRINQLLYQLKDQQSCQQKMPIVQDILSRICSLLEQDSYYQQAGIQQDSAQSLFQQLAMIPSQPDQITYALKKLLPEQAQVDQIEIRRQVAKLMTKDCRMRLF